MEINSNSNTKIMDKENINENIDNDYNDENDCSNDEEEFDGFTFDNTDFNKIPVEKERDTNAKKVIKQEKSENHKKQKRIDDRLKKKNKAKDYKKFLDTLSEEERNKHFDEKKIAEIELNKKLENGQKNGMKIIFDLSFQSHMRTKDIKSLAAQIAICYNLNKKIEKPFSFNVCSYIDEAKEQLDIMGSKSWKINIFEDQLMNLDIIKNKSKVIYLSPDSDEVLEDVTVDDIIVIGGFVDKPVCKFKSLFKAKELDISCKRLPLQEYIKTTNFNPVLNVNTVVEIIYNYLETKDWGKSIDICLPDRMYKK